MKNITVSVDDETYHRARIRAVLTNTSVSAMVRDALNEIAGSETEFERRRAEEKNIRRKLSTRECGFRAGTRLSRDEAHDRHAVR
jgi:predicted transcriptional regulator